MTTFNPSHDPFRESKGRHAQAVHRASNDESGSESQSQSQYPDQLPVAQDDDQSIDGDGHRTAKIKREARHRVKAQMPPLPDLRFEQVSHLSPSVSRALA